MVIKTIVYNVFAAIFILLSIMELSFTDIFSITELFYAKLYWLPHYWLATFEYAIGCVFVYRAFRAHPTLAHKFFETYARIGLGGMFIGASLFKIQDPLGFAILTAQYHMLPSFLLNIFSLFLPVLELITGVMLIFSHKTKESAVLIVAMMIMFIIALIYSVIADLGITCGCFEIDGAMDKNETWISLMRDVVLFPVVVYLTVVPKNVYLWRVWRKV